MGKNAVRDEELKKLIVLYRELGETNRNIWLGSGNLLLGSQRARNEQDDKSQ